MKEWRRVKEGDRETVLRILARHGVRTYEGFPLIGLSDEELRDVYATFIIARAKAERNGARARARRAIERAKRLQVFP